MADVVPELASTLQSASINRHPSPTHDINPSTAASKQEPIGLSSPSPPASPSSRASIASSTLDHPAPTPRRPTLPPLPDLRFEQSYLASLKDTKTSWDVIYVTTRDQVFLPLLQGTLWTLALSGWRYWNRSSALRGEGLGARVRRWWWDFNDWTLPDDTGASTKNPKLAEEVESVSVSHSFAWSLVGRLWPWNRAYLL